MARLIVAERLLKGVERNHALIVRDAIVVPWYGEDRRRVLFVRTVELFVVELLLAVVIDNVAQVEEECGVPCLRPESPRP